MMLPPRSADELVRRALADSQTLEKIRHDPEAELRRLAKEVTRDIQPNESDPWLYRLIVAVIGLTALISVVGAVVIAATSDSARVPDILTAIGSGSIGALAGFLTPLQYRR